jgi:prepilin-type N-terminal cleavage/methylation domain-containing protein
VVRTPTRNRTGFSIVELLLVVVVVAVLLSLLTPGLHSARAKSRRIACVNNLKQMGLGFRIFAASHGNQFPMQFLTNTVAGSDAAIAPATYFGLMSNELSTPKLLACPADDRVPAATWASFTASNISYFVGMNAHETFPQSLLAGDRNLTLNGEPLGPGLFAVSSNAPVGWSAALHRRAGNIALGDGSVQQVTEVRLREQVAGSDQGTNRLLIP